MKLMYKTIVNCIILVLFTSCVSFQAPTFEGVESVKVNEISNKKVSINVKFKVYNPNSIGFSLTDSKIDALINGNKINGLKVDTKSFLAANTTSVGNVDLEIPYNAILTYLPQIMMGQSLDLKLNGEVKVKKFLFYKTFQFDLNHKLKPSDIKL